ncbi:MAG TPA: 2-oxoacid:acceptor oxidoreductase subunit alpha, partial [Fervidobacterium sp.]|nr:2-oxoacid:acceptor oxidoreductase subunit alpha [Fervidobacterium sp.]
VRKTMVDKRLRKEKLISQDSVPPTLYGNPDYEYLVVAWGSTQENIKEALQKLGNDKVALLHFSQVYPVPPVAKEYFDKAKKVIFIEQNARGHFADLVRLTFAIDTSNRILKYDGSEFSVEEIVEALSQEVK